MKKLTFNIFYLLLVLVLIGLILIIYIKPSEQLNLKAEPINVSEKMRYMISNLKSEVVLTESDIDSLIKSHFNPNISEDFIVEGARFYVENNQLFAKLNVKYKAIIAGELNAKYEFQLTENGVINLLPISIHLKDIPLPISLIDTIEFQLYDTKNSLVKITDIENKARELVIKWKFDLF